MRVLAGLYEESMDVPQQIYAISCNRGWRLTWDFRQADVTWFCDVTLQTERTEYALSARGRNKKVARASAAYELASHLVEDGVLDIIEVMDWKELDPNCAPAGSTDSEASDPCSKPPTSCAADHVKAAIKPDMSACDDISAQLQTLTEFVRKQTEMYSTVVKSQAELIARLGKAVQDSDRRIDLLHSELRAFFEWITDGEFVPADTIQSKKPDVDEDGQYEPHEKPVYEDVLEAALETDLSVLCLGSPRSTETEPDVGESGRLASVSARTFVDYLLARHMQDNSVIDPPELEGWLHDEAEERETLVSSMPRRQSSRVTYELLGPTEIGWNNGDNESDFPRGFAEDPVVRMGSGTSWANTVNTSVEPEHRTTQRTMSGGASVVTGPSNGYGIPDRKEQDFPAYNYDAPSGTKKFGVQGTPRMPWKRSESSTYGAPPQSFLAQRNGFADSMHGVARPAGREGSAAVYQAQRISERDVGQQTSARYDLRSEGFSGNRQGLNHQGAKHSREYRTNGPQVSSEQH